MIFFFAWGCTSEPMPEPVAVDERPDIVLITIDTLRADRLGAYGDQHAKTPNLDQMAREGILFAESHSVTPLTLPSHASILTGLLPQHHQVRDNAGFVLADEYTTIAEALQLSGYATGAFISAYVLSHSWGVAQGFDTYHDPFHPQDLLAVAAFGEAQLPGNEVLNVAKKWWKDQELTNADKPRFAWIHLYDPHTPWEPGDSWDGDPYRGEIAKVDHWLGDLFALTDNAWVIVTSDHGESLWEHGEREHGVLLHRSVTRVPLIIRPPEGLSGEETLQAATWLGESLRPDGVDDVLNLTEISGQLRAAKIVREPVSGIDLAPTIAGLADVSLPSDGRDLLQPLVPTPVYAETYFPYFHYGWHPLSMVQNETQRLEQGANVKAVSVTDQQPMSPDSALLDAVQSMRGAHPSQLHQPISAEQESALAALGYQSSFVFPDVAETADPRDKMELLMALHEAEQQSPEQGIPILRDLVASEPMLLDARLSLSYLLSAKGDFEAALQECIEVLHVNPNHSVALNNSVILSHKLKQFDLAIQFANTMMQSNPRDVRPHRYLTAIYAEQDRPQAVIKVAGSGLQIEPNDPNLNYLKGLAHVLDQSFDQAIPHLKLADQNGSRANDIHLWMGIAAEELGKIDEAIEYYDLASSDMPVDPRPYARAGLMLAEADRCPEAKKYLVNLAKRLGGVDPTLQDVMQKCGIR